MALHDRYTIQGIFLMKFEASPFMVYALASPSPLKLLRRRYSPALGNPLMQASSLPCSLLRPSVPTWAASLCSCRVVMVRQRLISRRGGSRRGRGRTQTSHQASQAMTPPSSPTHKPLSYHAFQNFHFRLQSSLTRPIISANISIIFLEEESSTPAVASEMEYSSQEGLRIVGNHGIMQQQGTAGQDSQQGGLQTANKGIDGSSSSSPQALQPSGSIHGASASEEDDGSPSSNPQASNPPGGSAEGEAAHGEDIWYGTSVWWRKCNQTKISSYDDTCLLSKLSF